MTCILYQTDFQTEVPRKFINAAASVDETENAIPFSRNMLLETKYIMRKPFEMLL